MKVRLKLTLTLITFSICTLISNAQQVIDNDVQIGKYTGIYTGYGKRLTLSGVSNVANDTWLAKYSRGNNQTDLRINIGDDSSSDPNIMDRFSVGVTFPYHSTNWKNLFTVTSGGRVGINTDNPQNELDINGRVRIRPSSNNNGWHSAYLYFVHSLVIGSAPGEYAHNQLELKPGGYQDKETWSSLAIFRSPKQDEHEAMVFFTARPGANNYINSGNLGLGTSNPQAKLDVNGTLKTNFLNCSETSLNSLKSVLARLPEGNASGEGSYLGVKSYNTQPVSAKMFSIEHKFYGNINNSIDFYRGNTVTGGYIGFTVDNGTQIGKLNSNGLEIAGTIKAREVKIEITAGADHVFKPNYKLQNLEKVEEFVKKNNHLPEIPSEKEMQENGLSINDFQIKLLQKIEELTLYTIEQNKRIKQLEDALLNK